MRSQRGRDVRASKKVPNQSTRSRRVTRPGKRFGVVELCAGERRLEQQGLLEQARGFVSSAERVEYRAPVREEARIVAALGCKSLQLFFQRAQLCRWGER